MARPKINADDISARLIAAAEALLEETGGRRLVLSDVAARVGLSQSYAHRFFATKADLIRALAARWFEEVEATSTRIAHGPGAPEARIENWLLTLLRLKRDRFDENPALFRAYLDLAAGHPDLIAAHTAHLHADLAGIVEDLVGTEDAPKATLVIEDATLLFRTPQSIARHRERATDDAARAVLGAVLAGLKGAI